ncbi:hypothetical protein M5D96_004385, partial [Drosophila gunungcola]
MVHWHIGFWCTKRSKWSEPVITRIPSREGRKMGERSPPNGKCQEVGPK